MGTRARAALAGVLAGGLLLAGCNRGDGLAGSDARAPLADVCGAATNAPSAARPPGRAATGSRLTDSSAHLSYLDAGDPWQPWTRTISPGHLGALFASGYFLVTEAATPTGEYYASVLSGRVYPGDLSHPDLDCVATQVADDLRSSTYPPPNRRPDQADRALSIGNRPAHLVRFRLDYDVPGYAAHSEVVTVLVVDTGRADLALLYASIPDTAKEYEPFVDRVVASVQVT